jgi:TPR repeat protein
MEYLDLNCHDPEEYEGKLVVWNGCEYTVGEHLGTGSEAIVHKLINRKSMLCLHVLKIVRFPDRPIGMKSELIAGLRASSVELSRSTPFIIEAQLPGGLVEFQEYLGPYEEANASTKHLMDLAAESAERKQYEQAIASYNRVLELNPCHTPAMVNLASVYREGHDRNDFSRAQALARKAVQIEPNYLLYHRAHIIYSFELGLLRFALQEFSRMKSIFSNVFDLDDLGARMCLTSGDPEAASSYAEHALLEEASKAALRKEIEEARVAKARASELMWEARASIDQKDWTGALTLLNRAYAVYDKDPFLNMNLAFALRRAGEYRAATRLLMGACPVVPEVLGPVCMANSAFCQIEAEEMESGASLLDGTSQLLSILHKGRVPTNCADLPGIGIWIEDKRLNEENITSACNLVETAFRERPILTEAQKTLIEAYRTAVTQAKHRDTERRQTEAMGRLAGERQPPRQNETEPVRAMDATSRAPPFNRTPLKESTANLRKPWRLLLVGVAVFLLSFNLLFKASRHQPVSVGKASKDYAKALPFLQKAAEAGNAEAMNELGVLYYYGRGVAQDYAQAREWYKKAADAGNAAAKAALWLLPTKRSGGQEQSGLPKDWAQNAEQSGQHEDSGKGAEDFVLP